MQGRISLSLRCFLGKHFKEVVKMWTCLYSVRAYADYWNLAMPW